MALLGFGTAALLGWRPVVARAQHIPACVGELQGDIDAAKYKINAWRNEMNHLADFHRKRSNNYDRGYANAITRREALYIYHEDGIRMWARTFAENTTIDGIELPGGWPDVSYLGGGNYRLQSPGGGDEPVKDIQGRVGEPIKVFDYFEAQRVLGDAINAAENDLRRYEAERRLLEKQSGLCCPSVIRKFSSNSQHGAGDGQSTAQAASCLPSGGGTTPTGTSPTSSTTTSTSTTPRAPGPNCSGDNPTSPPAAGCVRVTVQVIPAPLPSDPSNESIGEGVGSATLQPGGKTIQCLSSADAPCVLTADVPANAPASVSAQPGSLSGDPSSPPDSAFWKFAGACSGTGGCTFTPASGATVDVYFIPAMVTLTLQASGDEGHANMTASEFEGGGLEPAGPVYCGFTYPSNPLPCKVLVRVEKFAQVEANTAGDQDIVLNGFSSNCTPEGPGSSLCDLRMTSDQTVTATFGAVGLA